MTISFEAAPCAKLDSAAFSQASLKFKSGARNLFRRRLRGNVSSKRLPKLKQLP